MRLLLSVLGGGHSGFSGAAKGEACSRGLLQSGRTERRDQAPSLPTARLVLGPPPIPEGTDVLCRVLAPAAQRGA